MEILKDKEKIKSFIKLFITLWMTIISLSPYIIASFALTAINPALGFISFDYLFNFLSPSIFLIIILFVVKRQNPSAGGIKEFIAANSKKVFLGGILLFYLIIIVSVVINLNNLVFALIGILLSLFVFPILFLIFISGKKIMDKMNKEIENGAFLENRGELLENSSSLGSEKGKFFLKYWSGNKDNIKTKNY